MWYFGVLGFVIIIECWSYKFYSNYYSLFCDNFGEVKKFTQDVSQIFEFCGAPGIFFPAGPQKMELASKL